MYSNIFLGKVLTGSDVFYFSSCSSSQAVFRYITRQLKRHHLQKIYFILSPSVSRVGNLSFYFKAAASNLLLHNCKASVLFMLKSFVCVALTLLISFHYCASSFAGLHLLYDLLAGNCDSGQPEQPVLTYKGRFV